VLGGYQCLRLPWVPFDVPSDRPLRWGVMKYDGKYYRFGSSRYLTLHALQVLLDCRRHVNGR
jgi:hypothetical protein